MAAGRRSIPAIAATVIVAATVIAAIVTTGGPSAQRAIRMDERRVVDLDEIVSAVNAYWHRRNVLPMSLDSMVSDHDLTDVPRDPLSNQPYNYSVTGRNAYRLCTTFQRPTEEDDGAVSRIYGKSWDHHPRGRSCYDLEPSGK